MANTYFQDRLDKLGIRKKALDSKSVSYQRKGHNSFSVTLTKGELRVEESIPGVIATRQYIQEWIGDSSDITPNGTDQDEPQATDQIIDGDDTYEVMVSGDDSTCFKYTTNSKARVRIFTKKVATPSA